MHLKTHGIHTVLFVQHAKKHLAQDHFRLKKVNLIVLMVIIIKIIIRINKFEFFLDYRRMFQAKCTGCEFPIEPGDKYLEAMGGIYHAECFNCSVGFYIITEEYKM
jgi:hypothetical protein